MNTDIPAGVREKAALILAEIQKSTSVLLHCHPSPDPDSVGTALAMKFAVEQLGKKATVFRGDSEIPAAFMHFPGATDIVSNNFWEMDLSQFDLFIIVDSAVDGVSRIKPAVIPESMRVVNIDHHATNKGDGQISLVDTTYPAAAELLFDLFSCMGITITPEIALNLFMGIYSDTGGFKYEKTNSRTFMAAAELTRIAPSFFKAVALMENSSTLGDLQYRGAALSSISTFCDGKVILSLIPYSLLEEKKIPSVSVSAGYISSILRSAGQFDIVGVLAEAKPGQLRLSFRTRDADLYDVSKLAASLGGGGHRAAAGAVLAMSLEDGTKLVLEKMRELFNL